MHDWLISKKNRYWGLALPIWECKKCGKFEVIGSREELEERAVSGWKEFKGKTPHKPQIDAVKIRCSKCGAEVSRVESVGNPWLDAGIVAYSTISENNLAAGFEPTKTKPLYLTDKESWKNWFPANFITESFPGQFKNWFYAQIAMSTVLEDTNPFRTVLGFGSMLDEKGEAFHKSKGNSIEFNDGADKIGVDVMRWMFARANPADNLLFGPNVADEVRRRFHLKLWNVFNFFTTYANLDGYLPTSSGRTPRPANVLDRWILVRLNEVIKLVTESLEKYDAYAASSEVERFVDDLSLWYIRRSRDRVGPAAAHEPDKKSFYATTHFVLTTLSKLMAPFTPFITETIYRNLVKGESVHLSDWPKFDEPKISDIKILSEMEKARQVTEAAHAIRKEKAIPVRQPLLQFSIFNFQFSKEISKLIGDEINVKYILSKSGKGDMKFKLDTKITKELKEESDVRELIRNIQEERKNMGLNLTQKVDVFIPKIPEDKRLLTWLSQKAQIATLSRGKFKVTRVK